jgi:hypothetical protein
VGVSTKVYQAIIETFPVQYQGKDKVATERMEESGVKVCFLPVVIGVLLVTVGVVVNLACKVDMKIDEVLSCIRHLWTESSDSKGLLEQQQNNGYWAGDESCWSLL